MSKRIIGGWQIDEVFYHCIIIGTGAAGMNCAKRLYEYLDIQGVENARECIAMVTAGKGLGASRMSGSDKQTYYKLGTSPDIPDSAHHFAESLTAGGCCHEDLALVEAIGSLRGFYNLVESGVPFPHDSTGAYIGYKTDHDPYERATSAGPKTSRYMSQCLEKIVDRYGVRIFDNLEVAELLGNVEDKNRSLNGLIAIDKKRLGRDEKRLVVFRCNYLILAGGGPGALYQTSVYPLGQTGLHGLAFKAGLAAENLTESQFGLSSIKFRWNVSGTYMQAIPRIFSTDENGNNEQDFLEDFFPTMKKMASAIFLKGYQWPFDPDRVLDHQSSLVDILVYNETNRGRRVFIDFLNNPMSGKELEPFSIENLEEEPYTYLDSTGAMQQLPIDRLAHMNPQAIEIYREHGINLYTEPLEIAVCAQHNNGGFGVNKWWQSNIENTFIIGEMAGTHGVKRPGGSALNAGQVGAERAAQYVAYLSKREGVQSERHTKKKDCDQITDLVDTLNEYQKESNGLDPGRILLDIQQRMTLSAAHIRSETEVEKSLNDAIELYCLIQKRGMHAENSSKLLLAVQVCHIALASIGYLIAIRDLLRCGGGSRGSYLVLSEEGRKIHPGLKDKETGKPIRFVVENELLRQEIQRVMCIKIADPLFTSEMVPVRQVDVEKQAFEPAWRDYREDNIYG